MQSEDTAALAPPPKPRTWFRRIVRWAAGVILCLLLLWLFCLTPWACRLAEKAVGERLGLQCHIASLRPPGWPGGWRVQGIRLTPRELAADPLASAVEIRAVTGKWNRRSLLQGRLDLSVLVIDGLSVRWRLGDRLTTPARIEPPAELPVEPVPPLLREPAPSLAATPPTTERTAAPAPDRRTAGIPSLTDPSFPIAEPPAADAADDRPISLWEGGLALATEPAASPFETDGAGSVPLDEPAGLGLPVEEPHPEPAPADTGHGLLASLAPRTAEAAPAQHPTVFDTVVLPEGASLWPAERRWSVGSVRITHGRFTVVGRDGHHPLFTASRWEMATPLPLASRSLGSLGLIEAAGWEISGRPQTGSLRAELHWSGDACAVKNLDVQLPGNGRATGEIRGLPFRGDGPCVGSLQLVESSLADLTALALPSGTVAPAGSCTGQVDFTVHLRHPRTLRMNGSLTATGLTLPLAEWARSAGLHRLASEIKSPVFPARELHADIRAAAGAIAIDDATLAADDLMLKSRGLLTTGGTVQAVTRCYVTAAGRESIAHLASAWPVDRRPWFEALENSPWFYHDLAVGGTVSSPRIEEWGRLWSLDEFRAEVSRLQALPQPAL